MTNYTEAFANAENHWRQGDFAVAQDRYRNLLLRRLADIRAQTAFFTAADLVIVERLADAAVLFGNFDAADDLLAGMATLCAQVNNRYSGDYASLKRIHLALGRGLLNEAYQQLHDMQASLGDIDAIQFSLPSLQRWEESRYWPDTNSADRAVLFSRLYLVMGRLLAALGQFGEALAALERGLFYTQNAAPEFDLARQAHVPLKLAIASVLLEKGNLQDADKKLEELASQLDELSQPGFYVQWLELSGKLSLLWADFGKAKEQFVQSGRFCYKRGFERATLMAALNLAHIMIYLNQVDAACRVLFAIRANALQLSDMVLAVRAGGLISLAYARSHALAENAPSVTEMWGKGEQKKSEKKNKPDKKQTSSHADDGRLEFLDGAISQEHDATQTDPLGLPQSENYLTFFEDRALGFQWLLGRGNLGEVASHLDNIKKVFSSTDSALILLRIKVLEGMLAYYQDEFVMAELILREACFKLRELGLRHELWQAQRIWGWCLAKLGRPNTEILALAQNTDALLNATRETLPDEEQAEFMLNKWTEDETYLARKIADLVSLKRTLAALPWWRRLRQHWRLMKHLEELIQLIDRYKHLLAESKVRDRKNSEQVAPVKSLWRYLIFHPPRRTTISFLVLPNFTLMVRMGWFTLDFEVIPFTRLQIRDLIKSWHRLVSGSPRQSSRTILDGDDDEKEFPNTDIIEQLFHHSRHVAVISSVSDGAPIATEIKKTTQLLAESLFLPKVLNALPKRIEFLTIVPDDSLHGFPFATIMHESQYLCERYTLSVAFETISRTYEKPASKDWKWALLVGVNKGTRDFAPLPGVQKELDNIETWLNCRHLLARRLMNESANKSVVIDAMTQAEFFHIACHGIFKPDLPDQSGMVLISRDGQVEILSLRELAKLNLAGLKHITLSSCWAADHFILPGRWIISLPETLWRAGAQSVLGCLWPVHDRIAAAFMQQYYGYLGNLPRDQALRQTQLDCLHGRLPDCKDMDTANPIHWAGFNLYGDYRRLKL